ncbi:hypothetical protein KIN20_035406 [Parelaphostrongylus tenuis]|uniref:Uncharacterized protein n=1 Tax=Parelaphostrongylus tenuis TaxID=148309 RepID=A0AAD5RB31_PARTN|nr:hypothetical protein KIN20_035406 [Parelaphostrongylus tenuis]
MTTNSSIGFVSGMNTSSPARLLAIYGGTTFLVYIETNGFVKSSPPFLLSVPILGLSLLTLTTNMAAEPRFKTSASFAVLAFSRYLLTQSSWSYAFMGYLLVSLANIIYCYSFSSQIRSWSKELTVVSTGYLLLLFYYCFADLLMSIPSLVLLLMAAMATSCVNIVGAGSVCQYGHVSDYDAGQASYIRLVGTLVHTAASSLVVLNLFGERTETLLFASRILFYVAQGLLFLANERTF